MMNFKYKHSGFSLVETLVAITILLIVIVGPMSLAANATQGTNFSSEQVAAFFLAQEGAEIAQKARDDILLPYFVASGAPDDAWNEFSAAGSVYADCFTGGCGLTIDTDVTGSVLIEGCNSASDRDNCRLYYNSDTNERSRYTHVEGDNESTVYTRIISLTETAGREIQVISTVSWRTGNQQREQSAEVITYLYNVYGR